MELVPPGPTLETYKRHMVTHGFPVDVEELQDFNLLWIGPRTATSVIAYGFGGGYVMPAFDAHFNVLIDGYKIMKSNNEDVSIVIINFGLCPTFPYPSQLRQAIIAIQNLTTTRPASKISLSGDSAGANLMLALLLHLNGHTHPKVPAFSLPSGQKFREAMLISPGAPIQTSATSMNRDPWKDMVTTEMIEYMFGEIQKTSEVELPNPWISNSDVPEEWWKGLPVEGVFVIVGEDEVLRDDILSWCAHLKKYHDGEVLVNVYPGEIHIQVYLDNLMGVTEDKASTKDFQKWFQEFKA